MNWWGVRVGSRRCLIVSSCSTGALEIPRSLCKANAVISVVSRFSTPPGPVGLRAWAELFFSAGWGALGVLSAKLITSSAHFSTPPLQPQLGRVDGKDRGAEKSWVCLSQFHSAWHRCLASIIWAAGMHTLHHPHRAHIRHINSLGLRASVLTT